MFKKILLIILFFFLVFQILFFYYIKNDSQNISNDTDKRIKIGFSMGTLKEERWTKDREILFQEAKEKGADIIMQNANNSDTVQEEQVKYLLKQGIDVLIIVANDYQKTKKIIESVKEKNIPVILYDRLVLDTYADLYISFDNKEVGRIMAESLLKKLNYKGNILIINGSESDYNTHMIKNGYDQILKPYTDNGDIKIIGEFWAENWLKEKANEIVNEIFKEGIKIDGIICGNDSLADGAIESINFNKMSGKIFVTGQDADIKACQRIVEGLQLMTVYKPINEIAEKAIYYAIELVRKNEIKTEYKIYNEGYDIPYISIRPVEVTKDNIDETVIKDGFHSENTVYKTQ